MQAARSTLRPSLARPLATLRVLTHNAPSQSARWSSASARFTPFRRRAFGKVTLALAPAIALLAAAPIKFSDERKALDGPHREIVKLPDATITETDGSDLSASHASELHVTQAELEDERDRKAQNRIAYAFEVYVWEPVLTARRFVYLFVLFFPVLLFMPVLALEAGPLHIRSRQLDANGKPLPYKERATTRWWYRMLVAQMERAGPTFIKLAQWAGSRRDLFPESLCALFSRLHADGKPHPIRHTKRCIERAFGKPFEEIFEEFNEKPMGIGAVGQAYQAKLRNEVVPDEYLSTPRHERPTALKASVAVSPLPSTRPGTTVAIKVLHPRVRAVIGRDLKIMAFFAGLLNMLPGMEWLSFPDEVAVFGTMMKSQLDLRGEAHNLQRFERNFRHRRTVAFPRAIADNTTRDVLVEEYEDAVPLGSFLNHGAGDYDDKIASLGLDAFLSMLLIDNFCHADLHPGNIMVKFYKPTTKSWFVSFWDTIMDKPEPDPAEVSSISQDIAHSLRALKHDREGWLAKLDEIHEAGYEPSLVFIDAGLVTTLEGANRKNFIDLFRAVAEFDGFRAGMLMVERCRTPELVVDAESFALRMQRLILGVKSQSFSLGAIRIGDVLSEVLQLIRAHHVRMEGDFVTTVLSILLLEGIGRDLDPNLDLFRAAIPILRQVGTQMRTTDLKDFKSDNSFSSLLPLVKLYLLVELNGLRSMGLGEVDDLLRYDTLAPSV